MGVVTQSEADTYLATWITAEQALAGAASYTFTFPNGQSRTVTRADIETIRGQIAYWHRVKNAINAKNAGLASPGVRTPRWT